MRRIGFVASEITKNGGVALCAPIAPYTATRRAVRECIAGHGAFIEIHVATPLEVCEARGSVWPGWRSGTVGTLRVPHPATKGGQTRGTSAIIRLVWLELEVCIMAWQLQDAKNRFSALVKAVEEKGPQVITVHGRERAVLLSAEDYRRL